MRRLLAVLFLALNAAAASATVWTDAEMDRLTCAEKHMQLMYYYLQPDRETDLSEYSIECTKGAPFTVKMPEWIEEDLPAMVRKPVWQDPEQGVLNEAQLWQAPVSVLYEFFEVTHRTFPPDRKGSNIPPGLLVKEYSDSRVRFQMSLDRLYRARQGDSLGGRGRAILATFDLILREMESIADGFSSGNTERYRVATLGIAELGRNVFRTVQKPPRGVIEPLEGEKESQAGSIVLTTLGTFIIFLGAWLAGKLNESRIDQAIVDYGERVRKWREDFNRQFVTIRVEYLVFGPFAFFLLLGVLSFDPFGFFICFTAGIYVGLNTPTWYLNQSVFWRSRKVEAQLMDSLVLMGNALKSGLDIVQAFEMVSREMPPPISNEFGLVIRNYQLGTPFERAMEMMEERVNSRLLSYCIKAIMIQRQVGGNLTKIFTRIVDNIREESKLEEKTAAMTAQQRIQAIVVGIMPWVMLFIMFIFQGQAMREFYFSPIGVVVLFGCAMWIGIGMKVVSKLGDIRV